MLAILTSYINDSRLNRKNERKGREKRKKEEEVRKFVNY